MLYSMTGFNRVKKDYPWGVLSVEISSVNSRYLELNVRVDRELTGYEPLIQNKDKLHVVAIVVDKATGQVLNAAKAKVGTSAVNEITDELKEVASTTYYDLTGRRVSNPDAGIYVKVVRYTDGSQRSFKVLKK